MRPVLVLVLFVSLLAGCAGGPDGARDGISGFFGGGQQAQKKPVTPPEEPRYCYRTLGKVNCYSQPLPGEEANRLVGFQGPAPRSTAGTGPLRP